MGRRIWGFFGVFLSIIVLFMFQNCGGFTSNIAGSISSPSSNFAIPVVESSSECFVSAENSYSTNPQVFYHLRKSPFNPSEYWTYMEHVPMPLVDPNDVQLVGTSFLTSGNKLYNWTEPVAELLPNEKVSWVGHYYVKLESQRKVFYSSTLLKVDYDTFAPLDRSYFMDKTGIYNRSGTRYGDGVVYTHLGNGFVQVDSKIFYTYGEVAGADANDFEVFVDSQLPIARSGSNYYFGRSIINQVINGKPTKLEGTSIDHPLWTDGTSVFHEGDLLAPLSSYKYLGNRWFNLNGVIYFENEPHLEIDSTSFEVFTQQYAGDATKIYDDGELVEFEGFSFNKANIKHIEGDVIVVGDWVSFGNYTYGAPDFHYYPNFNVNNLRCLGFYHISDGAVVINTRGETVNDLLADFSIADLRAYDSWYSDTTFYDKTGLAIELEDPKLLFGESGQFKPLNFAFLEVNNKIYSYNELSEVSIERSSSELKAITDEALLFEDAAYFSDASEPMTVENASSLDFISGSYYRLNESQIIYRGQIIEGVDIDTFTLAGYPTTLSYDKNSYYYTNLKVGDRNGELPWSIDSNWWGSGSRLFYREVFTGSFSSDDIRLVLRGSSVAYFRNGDDIYYVNGAATYTGERHILLSSDGDQFQFYPTLEYYWKDSSKVGYQNNVLMGVNPLTAIPYTRYWLDSGTVVYYRGNIVNGAVGGSLTFYPQASGYWTDGLSLFVNNSRITAADMTTFEWVNQSYIIWRDIDNLGMGTRIVPMADPASAVITYANTSRNFLANTGTAVYASGTLTEEANPNGQLQYYKYSNTVDSHYWTDGTTVFSLTTPLTVAPNDFQATGINDGRNLAGTQCFNGSNPRECN